MVIKNMVYLKVNNKIEFVQNRVDGPHMANLMRRHGLSYETFQEMVRAHNREHLVSYGSIDRTTGVINIHRLGENVREFIYEIDLTRKVIKAYSSDERTYKVIKFTELAQVALAA